VTSQTTPAFSINAFAAAAAAAAAQEHWVKMEAARLTCLDQSGREVIAAQLKSAATRNAADWTARFAANIFRFTLSSGLVFASVIGAALWATRIPGRHVAAATTAVAYLMIAIVALPVCWGQARRFLDQLDRISGKASRDFLVLYPAVMGAAALLYSIVNASALKAPDGRQALWLFYVSEFIAFAVVTAMGWLIAYLVMAYAYGSALQKSAGSQALSWTEVLAMTIPTAWLPAARTSSLPVGNPRLDSALLRLLRCVVNIDCLGHGQYLANTRSVRSVILRLELTAAEMEQYAVERVPRSDAVTRRVARRDGVRLASLIRDAKGPLARAIHSNDYMAVAARLAAVLLAWVDSGQDLTTMINDDAAIERISLWRRVVGRLWSPVLLAAAGIVLPLLPIYNNDHAAAAGLRYALLTAAVLSLVTNGTPAADTIERNLERTLPHAKP
jgi:hypothetical protein